MAPSINCQDGAIAPSDATDLARFGSALVICAWTPPTATLAVLASAGVPVGLFRFTQDPRNLAGWPGVYLARCRLALFANEPDLEGWPGWYADVYYAWFHAGGLVVEEAWSDEAQRAATLARGGPPVTRGGVTTVVSAHVYPKGRGAANLAAVRARAAGLPIWLTEAGDATAPGQILPELAALGVTTEPVFLYTYRAKDEAAQPAYNLAGVPLAPAPPEGASVPSPAPILRLPQQPGSLDCWIKCIEEFFLRYGHVLTDDLVFAAAKDRPRPAGGEAATFAEVKRAIAAIAQELGVTVQLADFDDPATVMAALHDPDTANPWTVIAGVKESDLQAGQNYGHFLLLDHEDAAGNITVTDSYAETDGDVSGVYPKVAVEQAMVQNWEPQIDAIGVKILG